MTIETTYTICSSTSIDLPEGKTWDDVDDFWAKWDTLHVNFKDGTSMEHELDTDVTNAQLKIPDTLRVFGEVNGETDYEKEL